MRKSMTVSALWLMCLLSGLANGSEPQKLEKIKTGILPTGGFYSIYKVACADNSVATIGALSRRGGPWCAGDAGGLQCFRRSVDASQRACSAGSLAERDADIDALNKYQ
ncbi:MAG: hypothetical protein ACI9NT_000793 [Bacteroidia bacterium]|jgi:hypothetical protein